MSQTVEWDIKTATGIELHRGSGNQIDVAHLSSGVYFLHTSLGTVKIVK